MAFFKANTLWRDAQYYLSAETGNYMPKYVLILATSPHGDDALSAVLTSKSNGLREEPACDPGPPRAGYYLGVPGGNLTLPTWVDFSAIQTQDALVFNKRIRDGRIIPAGPVLSAVLFCGVLRCLGRSDDISQRQHQWLANTVDALGCR